MAKQTRTFLQRLQLARFHFSFTLPHHSWVNSFAPPNCHNLFIHPVTSPNLQTQSSADTNPAAESPCRDAGASCHVPTPSLSEAASRPHSWCLFPVASVTAVGGPVSCGPERLWQMSTVLSQRWDETGVWELTGSSCLPLFCLKVRKHITDLYEDLRDGHNLISLLEVLSGVNLVCNLTHRHKTTPPGFAPHALVLRLP